MPLIIPSMNPLLATRTRTDSKETKLHGNDTSSSSVASSQTTPTNFAVAVPNISDTTIHGSVIQTTKNVQIFLSTSSTASNSSALGSFVCAMPNRFEPSSPLCTALVTIPESVEFATRVARVVVRKEELPVYVGSSVALPMGVTVDEEMQVLKTAVDGIMHALNRKDRKG